MSTVLANTITAVGGGGSTLKMANNATYVSEGTAVTQNTVQGLVKAWCDFDTSNGNTLNGSFNIGSITDVGTGDVYLNYTNNMNDVHYSGQMDAAAVALNYNDDKATNRLRSRSYSDLSTAADGNHRYFLCAGDLA